MPSQAPEETAAIAIETSGRIGSLALSRGPQLLETVVFSAAQRHAVELLPSIETVCHRHGVSPSSLGEVYVSAGPGSFTGLRLGITVARTLAWAVGAGVVAVPTLDVIAQNVLDTQDPPANLVVVLDAKRQRVYAASFSLQRGQYQRADEPNEWDVDRLAATLPAGCPAVGEGIAYHAEAIARAGFCVLPEELNRARAEAVQRLGHGKARSGQFDDPGSLVPIYVRRPEAEEVWERRYGSAATGRPPGP